MSNNLNLSVLKAIGIIVVVSGHLGANIFNLIGIPIKLNEEIFPEYSYHMPLFIFASGYFYKIFHELNINKLIKKRFESIKKYFNCNICYFFISFILIKLCIFNREINFNLTNLFVEPFLGGFQFYFNGPGWFVPFLFFVQILYVLLRKILCGYTKATNKLEFKKEALFFIFLIIIGFFSVIISNNYPVLNDKVNFLHSFLRVLFGLPFFQLGFLYNEFIESKLNISIKSFCIIIILKFILNLKFQNYTFSLRTLKFENECILPFVFSCIGIFYCLHLSHFIISIFNNCKVKVKIINMLNIIGNSTWSIMMHHLFVKWSLNKFYNFIELSNDFINILNYFVTPVMCILLPIVFKQCYDSFIEK